MGRNSKATQEANLAKITRGILVEGKTQGEIASEIGVTRETVNRNWNEQMSGNVIDVAREEICVELDELRAEIEKHRDGAGTLTLKAIDSRLKVVELTMRVKVPERKLVGHFGGPQLDALYLDVRQVLLDVDEADRPEGLQLLQDWAKTKIKPRVLVATKFITEGTE